MAHRMLHYHEQLEQEIEHRTEDVNRDLKLAREFQQTFLPHRYPVIPTPGVSHGVSLRFHHVYRPAQSVGGDFFDVIKLSDYTAGVFIADVMGHGVRSALITAVLRTLVQDLARTASSPAALLETLNKRFCALLPRGEELIFVTACYLVVDTAAREAVCACAGHPSPLLVRRERGQCAAVLDQRASGSALGIYSDVHHEARACKLASGDAVLLFTDGVLEAPNISGDVFGWGRLKAVVEQNQGHQGAADLTDAVIEQLHAFMDTVVAPDDICLVSVEMSED